MKNIISIFLLFLLPLAGHAQTPRGQSRAPVLTAGFAAASELGRPFIRNYTSKEFGAAPSNWAIAQDRRGVMYFGNAEGLLEYDGVSWRRIATPNRTVVRSLAADPNGRIYVGEVGAFGYLAPDSIGQMRFVSLLDQAPPEERKFADVWSTGVTSQGVYFSTYHMLFRWAENRLRIWKPQTQFQFAFVIRDTLYIDQKDRGLMRMAGDSLALVPGSEMFAASRIRVLLPFDDHRILIGTLGQGLYLYDGLAFHPFATAADLFLRQNQLYQGLALPNGAFALATIRGGVAIIDRDGRLLQRVDKTAGLQDNFVLAMHADRQSGFWLALYNGIAHIETPAPLSLFGEEAGLKGDVVALIRHQGTLYAATTLGVFYLNTAQAQAAVFQPVAAIATQCWSFLSHGDDLLVATNAGVYRIAADKITNLGFSGALALHRSRQDSNRVFVGLIMGLGVLQRNQGKWSNAGKIAGIEEEIRSIAEDKNGALWLGAKSQGILRLTLPASASALETPRAAGFGASQGLPEGELHVYAVGKRFFFTSHQGVFRFDEANQHFIPDSTFGAAFANGAAGVEVLAADKRGNVWLVTTYETGDEANLLLRQPNESFQRLRTPFLRVPKTDLYAIYPDDQFANEISGVVWYGGAEELVRYDRNVQKNYATSFSALIRRVIVNTDSIIFAGADASEGLTLPAPTLSYQSRALRFEFSATSFEAEEENLFQTYLEGFDKEWSPWTKETKKDYTNLSAGQYYFRVRARNIYEHESSAGVYEFKILPPWYRAWWAYLFYVLSAGAGVAGLVKLRTRQLQARSRALEKIVRKRTAEIQAQKENVELLSRIGKDITASLDFDTIFYRLYENVNQLADATIFGVGVYHAEQNQIEYKLAIAKGKRYAPYVRDTKNKNQFPVWCIENRQAVFINEVAKEYGRYIDEYKDAGRLLEDGTRTETPESLIYLPLLAQDRVLGVITIQSFQKNAYTEYHLNLLQNLAAYTTIALDNANAYRQLNAAVDQLHAALEHLQATQQQLVTQEKLASLGQLTAGIAHEIKNPLNFVNNFASLSVDLANELREEIEKSKAAGGNTEAFANVEEILETLAQNAKKINHHGKRADSIVRSMLQLSRGKTGARVRTDINQLLDESVNLVYHGFRANDSSFNIAIEKELDPLAGQIEVVPEDIGRVFLNLLNNACYAVQQRKKDNTDKPGSFSPTLSVSTKDLGDKVEIRIRDNGNGIPADIREKIFNPFFTTKPTGQGTGLGLSISYDIIVQEHRGEINVETEEGKFTEFVVRLPKNA